MWALLLVWAAVFALAGSFVTYVLLTHPHDEYERLAARDRKRVA